MPWATKKHVRCAASVWLADRAILSVFRCYSVSLDALE